MYVYFKVFRAISSYIPNHKSSPPFGNSVSDLVCRVLVFAYQYYPFINDIDGFHDFVRDNFRRDKLSDISLPVFIDFGFRSKTEQKNITNCCSKEIRPLLMSKLQTATKHVFGKRLIGEDEENQENENFPVKLSFKFNFELTFGN